jgi:hypothetical protein
MAVGWAEYRHAAATQEPQDTIVGTPFLHGEHRTVECTSCHVSTDSHGAITITEITDCRSCHHTGEPASNCSSCHADGELVALGGSTVAQTLAFSVLDAPTRRDLPFDHDAHQDTDCTTCHQANLTQTLDDASCATCHEEHHEASVTCMACHVTPVATAHTVENHVGCTGAGCHTEANLHFEGVPRQNEACLVCHQDLVDHRPGQQCAECHALGDGGTP